jgi:transposase-like protein
MVTSPSQRWGALRFAVTGVIMNTEIIAAPNPACPTCGSEHTNSYDGIEYDDLIAFQSMECDDCGTKFDCLWTRAGIENVQPKTAKV